MSKRRSVRLAETCQEPLGRASIGQAFVVEKSSLPGRASRRTARRILGRISRRSGRFAPRASAERLCALKRFALAANKATAGRFAAQAAPAPPRNCSVLWPSTMLPTHPHSTHLAAARGVIAPGSDNELHHDASFLACPAQLLQVLLLS